MQRPSLWSVHYCTVLHGSTPWRGGICQDGKGEGFAARSACQTAGNLRSETNGGEAGAIVESRLQARRPIFLRTDAFACFHAGERALPLGAAQHERALGLLSRVPTRDGRTPA